MTFSREKLTRNLFSEMEPLLLKHWDEIAHYKDIPLAPDYEAYLKMEEMGAVRAYTARMPNDLGMLGELLGYNVFFVRKNVHYSSSLQAVQDVIYIDRERRGFGYRFIKWCDEQLKAEGVQIVYNHIKAAHNFGEMLERLDYKLVDLIYAKRLDGG